MRGLIRSDTASRDLFDAKLMGILTPRPPGSGGPSTKGMQTIRRRQRTGSSDSVRTPPHTAALACGDTLQNSKTLEKHADWAEGLKKRYRFAAGNAEDTLRREVGMVFAAVLEHAGSFKCTPEGRGAFLRFIHSIG